MPYHVIVKTTREGMGMESDFTCPNDLLLQVLTDEINQAHDNQDRVTAIMVTYERGF